MKLKTFFLLLLLLISVLSCSAQEEKSKSDDVLEVPVEVEKLIVLTQTEAQLMSDGFLLISEEIPSIKIDLKYATIDNFTKKVLYKDLTQAFLHPIAIEKLKKAQEKLQEYNPEYRLLVYDAARPLSVQKEMYNAVKNTRYHLYVAHPSRTSLHNYGLAVDLTVHNGQEVLDMGTSFDFFGKEAGIYREDEFLRSGVFTKRQIENRKLLRKVMLDAGFQTIRGEWWHFNACSLNEAKKRFRIIK